MTDIISLLAGGYFPEELPPPFTTEIYAKFIGNNLNNLPPSYNNRRAVTKAANHSIARVEILRRPVAIPNPVQFYNLCQVIATNWQTLSNLVIHSPISHSFPTVDSNRVRALIPNKTLSDLKSVRVNLRATSQWILSTDIQKFYSSIYTHSIAWAIHGKLTAKSNHSPALLGNLLDLSIRNCQDGQTVGVPIGPDTSLLIAEIILCQVDAALMQRIPNLNALRFVDDYEFGFKTYAEAEQAMAILQELLQDYELSLNFAKTSIVQLPSPLDPSWIIELRQFELRRTPTTQYNDLVQYFSTVFALATQNPRDHVLKYGINRLRSEDILNNKNWLLLQNLLLQCVMAEKGTLQPALSLLIDQNANGYQNNLQKIGEVLNFTIQNCSPLGYTNEVAWAIWGLIYWNLFLDNQSAKAISNTNDTIIALVALDAYNRGLIPTGLNLANWQRYMTKGDLHDKQWLLAYEANIKGWLPSRSGRDHVAADSDFGFLKANNVYFYDTQKFTSAKIHKVFPSAVFKIGTP
jgi:Reverse transcriptase (RNA-dependent DNA polymerase)